LRSFDFRIVRCATEAGSLELTFGSPSRLVMLVTIDAR
jgi:hypothetical protein